MIWQSSTQESAEFARRQCAGLGGEVSDQPGVFMRISFSNNDAFAKRWMGDERRLDLGQLNAKAANLDLLIAAAGEFQHAVSAQTREISGAIEPPEFVGDESL